LFSNTPVHGIGVFLFGFNRAFKEIQHASGWMGDSSGLFWSRLLFGSVAGLL
jgi:hypothetical protein